MSVGMVNRGRVLAVWALTLSLAGLVAPLSYAQTGTLPLDSYLHGSGGTTNPPTLTLDLLPSISLTAKTKDSPALNFSGGNPWQVLGSWIPPSGSTGSFTITAVGPTHLWTGLKASGDVGGKIDLLTEVLVNGSVISSGLTRCLSTLTASSSTPVDVSVALGNIPVTSINPATQTLALRLSARMGTTATNAACGTKTSVTGVRLYFDALTRLSRLNVTFQTPPPVPVALISNPFSIKAGTTASLTAILFPVPVQATSLAVTSTSPSMATVPATGTGGGGPALCVGPGHRRQCGGHPSARHPQWQECLQHRESHGRRHHGDQSHATIVEHHARWDRDAHRHAQYRAEYEQHRDPEQFAGQRRERAGKCDRPSRPTHGARAGGGEYNRPSQHHGQSQWQ